MESRLAQLASAVSVRRKLVLAAWLALLAGGSWFSVHQADYLSSGGWEIPGSQSSRAGRLLETFPGFATPTYSIVVVGNTGPDVAIRVREASATASRDPEVLVGPPQRFDRGRAMLVPVAYVGPVDGAIDAATRLRGELVETKPTTSTRLIGVPAAWSEFHEISKRQLATSEAIGFPLILIILLVAFGTLVAALTPAVIGFASVFLTGAVIYALSRNLDMSVYVTNMASMIGIGVAVDYSLFIVSRFRRELRAGMDQDEALRRSMASAGTAVVFSGATVAASLSALYLIDVNAVRSMATGAIVVVCISVLASITLLPAMLSLLGGRINRLRVPLPWATGEEGSTRFWQSWTQRVMARPVVALTAGTTLMLVLASPLLAMQTFNKGLAELPKDSEVRAATERAWQLAGPGVTGPVHVIVTDRGEADAVARRLQGVPGVAAVRPVVESVDGRAFLVDTVLDTDPESPQARQTYRRIRSAAPSATVGGETAFDIAVEDALSGGLWRMLLFILAISYVFLLVLLRSVLLPLKAVAMNLLSVGAAYGVLVAIFQWGWLDWTGYDSPGYIDAIVPALVLAVTFGLSMDYEVFLMTRIRERYAEHGRNDLAVAQGLLDSARVITSAALIMVAVFAAFAIAGSPTLRELGVGLAVAVGLDATIVRLVIVPATMALLGERNWWLPRPLARVLVPNR